MSEYLHIGCIYPRIFTPKGTPLVELEQISRIVFKEIFFDFRCHALDWYQTEYIVHRSPAFILDTLAADQLLNF